MSSPPRDIDDLLEQARRACLNHLSKLAGEGAILEPSLRTADGMLAYDPQGLKTPLRKDVAIKTGESWTTKNVDSPTIRASFPICLPWNDRLTITVRAVTWDYVTFLLSPRIAVANWQWVRDWFLKWFDPDDANAKIPEGLQGVTHFISDPEAAGERIKLIVDFGSAPTWAFVELLDRFAEVGFTHCDIE